MLRDLRWRVIDCSDDLFGEMKMQLRGFAMTLLLATGLCTAQDSTVGRPVIGVALEGGGALGLAHIGVLAWMEDNRIPVDRLAGTSMGSLIGGLYASGMTVEQLRTLATGNAFTAVFTLQPRYTDIDYRRREDRRELPGSISVGLRHGPQLRNALLSDRGVNEFLARQMSAYNSEALDYDQMPIPFRCVATDLNTLGPVVFTRGPLPNAVRASISIPSVFPPVIGADGHALVDGGIVDNLPSDVVRRDLHADVVIAVHLDAQLLKKIDIGSVFGVLDRAFSVGIARNEAEGIKAADRVIVVDVGKFTGMDYDKGVALMAAGYSAAEANRAVLRPYMLNETEWKSYLAARRARIRPEPGLLQRISIVGGSASAQAQVTHDMKPLAGKPIRPASTLEALKGIQAAGGMTASFETFAPENAPTETGVRVQLNNDPIGPPYLLLAPEYSGTTNNLMRVTLNLRLVAQNLGGFGSELRATSRLGTMNSLAIEYYKLLSPHGYFVQPLAEVSTEPVYIWQNQARIAERSLTNLVAGVAAGRTFSHSTQLATEWRFANTHWNQVTGTGGGPFLSGSAQSGQLRLTIDHAQTSTLSPVGWRMTAAGGALYHAEQSSNAPLLHFAMGGTYSIRPEHILGVSGEVSSYLRTNVAEPYRFTLGGPMRLSASSFDEYRGTDVFLARTAYMRRIASLPTGLGHGLYGVFGYEGGEIWSPEQRVLLRQDGIVGLIGNTPMGLITVGVSVGDTGHRKVFFTLGRWF